MTRVLHARTLPRPEGKVAAVARQVVRYALVGGLGTAVNAAVFLLLRLWLDAVPANLVALVLSTVVSTEANRRFTFQDAPVHRARVYVQTVGTVAFYALYSSAVLVALHAVLPEAGPVVETVTVAVASVLGGAARFLLLRYWVVDRHPDESDEPPPLRTWLGALWWTYGERAVHAALVLAGAVLLVLVT